MDHLDSDPPGFGKDPDEKEATPKWAKWGVDFFLAYDGGGSDFTKFYRTKTGARISIVWKKYVTSWGGTANLFPVMWKKS